MTRDPNLVGIYVGLCVGLTFVVFSLWKVKKAPDFTATAVIILSCAGAVVGLHLGYVAVTIEDSKLGQLAQHRLPVILGALAVVWTAVGSLHKTWTQTAYDAPLAAREPQKDVRP